MVSPDGTQVEANLEHYSFSKLSSWWTCPYGFYLRYILKEAGISNAFASFGTLVHGIMERYAKGKTRKEDLADLYEWQFDSAVPEKFPYNKYVNLRDSYYKQGLMFLKDFEGYDNYEILGVEEEFELKIDDWTFVGVIDLVFRDEEGRLIIRDYKSKASFKNAEEQHKYARQLYLYALFVKEKYGEYPEELQFLMFRKNRIPLSISFDENDLQEAVSWAKNTVATIRNAFDYPAQCDDFYGSNLCNFRETCKLKPRPKHRPRKK